MRVAPNAVIAATIPVEFLSPKRWAARRRCRRETVTSFADLQRFMLTLPETSSTPSYGGAPALRVNKKMFARLRGEMADDLDPLTGAPYGEVLMVGVADLGEKEALLASDERAYFTVSYYDGYPAVLVRLAFADETELRELLVEAWMRTAPKRALKAYRDSIGPLPGEA